LIDRAVVDALRKFEDYYPYTRGLIAQCGFQSTGIPYEHLARQKGAAKGRLLVLLDLGLNGLISFTKVPLRLMMLFGFLVSIASIVFALVELILVLVLGRQAPPGIATLSVALFFFSGVQILFMGFLGEYIAAIHFQVRKRPLVIEKRRINFEDK
jgi:glycosyltransferase involved in cell wall biosynthesis